jgi:hypothetical protein
VAADVVVDVAVDVAVAVADGDRYDHGGAYGPDLKPLWRDCGGLPC